MRLKRQDGPDNPISIVSMIDVLMILLIFFMVTSTYLRLGMVPLAERPSAGPAESVTGRALLVRLAADGALFLEGRPKDLAGLAAEIGRRRSADPDLSVLVLPSGQARTQALVSLMDALSAVGVTRLRLVSLEGAP